MSAPGWGDVGLWSELDPTWNDPKMAALKSPEGVPSGSAMAALTSACGAEYIAMQADPDYFGTRWCTGASGQTYPLSGYATNSGNPALLSALGSTRLLDQMYLLGMQRKTWGTESQVCFGKGSYETAIPKRGHRFQQVAPKGEKENHRIGDRWSAGFSDVLPAVPGLSIQGHEINNNNYIFIDWKYKECCIGI
jgi:conjugal transfer pilus assembly protein TraU